MFVVDPRAFSVDAGIGLCFTGNAVIANNNDNGVFPPAYPVPITTPCNAPNSGGIGATLPLNLTEFARERDVQTLQSQSAAFQSELATLSNSFRKSLKGAWIGSALSGSLVTVNPREGDTNRLGMNVSTVQGQSAIGISYIHTEDEFDINAGLAISASSSRYSEARVGLGFSW